MIIDFMSTLANLGLKTAILKFYEILNHVFELLVPKIRFDLNYDPYLPWSNKYLRNLIILKN